MVCDYLGSRITEAQQDPATLHATLSLEKLQRYREKFPAWKDADSFELKIEQPAP